MNKQIVALLIIFALLGISACGASEDIQISDKAVGAVFVNEMETLLEDEKIYADFENNNYTFNLDAAWVYYFNYDAETAFAGNQNFTAMTFGANLDSGGVGAGGDSSMALQGGFVQHLECLLPFPR